jgi:hypothetical protein
MTQKIQDTKPETRDNAVADIAQALRSTEPMAVQFAKRVQERTDPEEVSYADVLAAIQKISPKRLTMSKVLEKVRRELE